jgi:Asp-tRNA(Asn)/Glu-tRNA(Gln) amidotransferase A subunit family amidase
MTDDTLCDHTAVALRRLIGAKQVSPVEVLAAHEARIARINPAINAMVALDTDRARAAARAAEAAVMQGDPLGPLHGLPFGVKDLEETEGLRTTWGSPQFEHHVPTADEWHIAALKRAGGIVLGKTNVPEFGAGANSVNKVYGACGNPFDPMLTAAGSSGGSAAALAAGLVPIATGSDTGGSLRNPAAFCGVIGYRVTVGLIPTPKRPFGWSVLSTLGPMARTVGDVALMLSAMVGDDARDPLATTVRGLAVQTAERYFPVSELDLASLRVAFSADLGFAPTSAAYRAIFARRADLMRGWFAQGADAHPDMTGADEAFEVLRAAGYLVKHVKTYRTRPDLLGPNLVANVEEALRYDLEDHAKAHAQQTVIYHRMQHFFRDHDLLITPGITTAPFPWTTLFPAEIDGKRTRTYFHWLALAYGVTLTGHPAILLPCGVDERGLPFGIQVVGPRGSDAWLLRAAAALERRMADHALTARPLPDLAKLAAAEPLQARSLELLRPVLYPQAA